VEYEVVKVQKRKAGSYMVTIPAKIAKILKIEGGEYMKAYIVEKNGKKVLVYEKI